MNERPNRVRVEAVGLALALLMAACPVVSQPVSQRALLQRYECYACHGDGEARAGPAYADVAARYRKTPHAVARLADVIRKGAHGSGQWHMPAHPEISKADAVRMARYILSQQ
jgi:cytochrome c